MRVRSYFCFLAFFCIGILLYNVADFVAPSLASRANQRSAQQVPNSPFVSSYGGQLYLNGAPYIFQGLNIYNVTSQNPGCWYSFEQDIDANLNQIGPGLTAFRGWFYQQEATIKGKRDWSGFDHVLSVAHAHGDHVIVVLANQWNTCEVPPPAPQYKAEPWYQTGYRTSIDPGMFQTYRDWVISIVNRYANDPTILAWQLMDEAEDRVGHGLQCSKSAYNTMYNWVSDVSTLVKSIDPNHLVSLGTIGTGQCPFFGNQFQSLHALPNIDLCEFHDYFPTNTVMPGDQFYNLPADIIECKQLGKPLFVGESGILGSHVNGNLALRAADFATKFAAYCTIGAVGELIWDWRSASQGGSSQTEYQLGPGDPALSILGLDYCNQHHHAAIAKHAVPAPDSTITQAPTMITVECAENISHTLSNLFVYGPDGALISQGNATVSLSNPMEMSITIKPAGSGVYRVRWITLSARDRSPAQGSFVFTVNSAGTSATKFTNM